MTDNKPTQPSSESTSKANESNTVGFDAADQDPDATQRYLPRNEMSEASTLESGADFGDYVIEDEIARGGMGVVFKARQKRLNRTVALKVIRAGELAGADDIHRFQAEAEAAANLQHSGIVPVFEVGESAGRHYFSMGYVDGSTLADAIANGPVEGRQAAQFIAKIADAVAYAHENGVIHRDLKPGNILLDRESEPRITDFGLAKRMDSDSQLTGTGEVLGTPSYMAPEQASGQNDTVGASADVYALGAILYSLLTGRPPFQAASIVDTLMQVVNQEPVPPRQLNSRVDRDIETICLKCLQKEPRQRYASAAELRTDVERFLNVEPIRARPIGMGARVWRWCRRNPGVSALAGVLAFLVVLLAVIGPWLAVRESNLRDKADRLVLEKSGLIDDLNLSIQETQAAKSTIEEAATQLNRHLSQMYVDRGIAEIERGKSVAALPWFSTSLRMSDGDSDREWANRFRIASVLTRAPRLLWVRQLSGQTRSADISRDRHLIAAGSENGELAVWETSTGTPALARKSVGRGPVADTQISPDGNLVAAATGKSLQIWDIANQQLLVPEITHGSLPIELDFDESGELLAVGLFSGKVLLYRTATGELVREFSKHKAYVHKLDVSNMSQRLVSGGHDNSARLSDLASGELVAELPHDDVVVWAEFNSNGTEIVTASQDGTARVWNAATGEPITPPLPHPDRVRIARFDQAGLRVATGCYDSAARIWDARTGELRVGPMKHENSVPDLDFSSDNRLLITAGVDHTSRIWDSQTGKLVSPALHHGFFLIRSAFLTGDNQAVTACADRTIRAWEFSPRANLAAEVRHEKPVRMCRFNHNSTLMLTASSDGTAKVSDTATGKTQHTLNHGGTVTVAEFSADGKLVATGSEDGRVRVWNADDGQLIHSELKHPYVWQIQFDGDARQLLVASHREASLWDLATGQKLHRLAHDGHVRWARFSPDFQRVLTCGESRAQVWDVATGAPIGTTMTHVNIIEGGEFSPDGDRVVTCSRDHTAQVWNWKSGKKLIPALRHFAPIQTAFFTLDGSRIVTGSSDGSARLWNASSGAPATPPLSIGRGQVRVTASPCGKFLATAGFTPTEAGQAAMLWDMSGRALGFHVEHDKWVNSLQFSSDSRKLLTGSEDGSAKVWTIPSPDLRSVEQLTKLSERLSGQRVDEIDGLVPIQADEMENLLK